MRKLSRVFWLICVLLLLTAAVGAANTPQAFYEELFTHLRGLEPSFSIDYDADPLDLGIDTTTPHRLDRSITQALSSMAVHVDAGIEPDVYRMNIDRLDAAYDGRTFAFSVDYLLTAEQLAWTDGQIFDLAEVLFREGADEYEKVKAAYSYVATHFTYDDTLTKFTDYDGLTTGSMVCQGYALLMTKLLARADVDCRIITGWADGVRHGWNIVKVDGLWYCMDVTWDAEENFANWDHFLMSREDFKDHEWDDAFRTDAFLQKYIFAAKSYSVPQIDILIDGTLYSGLTIRKDKQLALKTRITPWTDQNVTWATTNEKAVSVTADGLITSVSPGVAYVTASVAEGGYIEGVLSVTAVDLTSCSSWADAELNALYLRQMYPAALCERFQTNIRRDEFAHLAYLWMRENTSQPEPEMTAEYEDLEQNDYWFSIIFATTRGIFNGTSELTFSPSLSLTREQAAKVLFLLTQKYGYGLEKTTVRMISDYEKISDWAKEYVDFVLETGLMQGRADGRFDPQGILTREEAAVLMERFCTMTLDKVA